MDSHQMLLLYRRILLQQTQRQNDPETQAPPTIAHFEGPPQTEGYQAQKDPYEDLVDAQIQAYLQRPVTIGKIDARFENLDNFTADMRPVTLDFPDRKMLHKAGIRMYELSSEDVISIGRSIMPMVASGFTWLGAAYLFTLAYNVLTPGGNYSKKLFAGVEDLESIEDKLPTKFSERQMVIVGTYEALIGGGNPAVEAAVYPYLALSMMRLFTKSPNNYVKAWTHIQNGFAKFYGDQINFHLPTPNEQAIKSLAYWFSIEPKAKQTLYRLLYMSNASNDFYDFKTFLFEIHLAYTGMHLAGFFVNLCIQLNCSSGVLLQVLNVREYRRQIDCLVGLMKILKTNDKSTEKGMWKYGRIFDETFMYDIQTKSCPKLVFILGEALRTLAPRTYENFDKIAQLTDISEPDKRKCKDIALKLLSTIRANGKDT